MLQYSLAGVTDDAKMQIAFESIAPVDGVINATGVVAFGGIAESDDLRGARLFAVNTMCIEKL